MTFYGLCHPAYAYSLVVRYRGFGSLQELCSSCVCRSAAAIGDSKYLGVAVKAFEDAQRALLMKVDLVNIRDELRGYVASQPISVEKGKQMSASQVVLTRLRHLKKEALDMLSSAKDHREALVKVRWA